MQNNISESAPNSISISSAHNWVDRYADYLYNYAICRVNDTELAKDLVQETFLSALEQLEKFEARSSERTWLTAILKNKIIDGYRKKSALSKKIEMIDLDNHGVDFFERDNGHWKVEDQPRIFGIDEFDPISSKEFNEILRKCIQKLPTLWLAVFTMKHLDDQDTAIICTDLKVTAANFWVIMHRSKVNLRACLQKNWL